MVHFIAYRLDTAFFMNRLFADGDRIPPNISAKRNFINSEYNNNNNNNNGTGTFERATQHTTVKRILIHQKQKSINKDRKRTDEKNTVPRQQYNFEIISTGPNEKSETYILTIKFSRAHKELDTNLDLNYVNGFFD